MLVQRRIQEEIHGNKVIVKDKRPNSHIEETIIESQTQQIPVEIKSSNGRRSQIEERSDVIEWQ